MTNERRTILEMLRDRIITVEEAEQLLDVLQDTAQAKHSAGVAPRHVVITVLEGGFVRSNVRLPLTFVRTGLRLGKGIASISGRLDISHEFLEVMETLRGVDFDELLTSVSAGIIALPYLLAEIDDENGKHMDITLQ